MEHFSDFLTGERLSPGCRVVAFLTGERSGTAGFSLASLPLPGELGADGTVHFDEPDGIAIRMATRLAHLENADELARQMLGQRGRAQLMGKKNHESTVGFSGDFSREYSLAIVSHDNFHNAAALQGGGFAEVRMREVLAMIDECEQSLEAAIVGGALHESNTRTYLHSMGQACALQCDGTYLDKTLRSVPAPELCTVLRDELFSADFVEVARSFGMLSLLNQDPRRPEDGDGPYRKWVGLRSYLTGLWQARCFVRALRLSGASFYPSQGDMLQDRERAEALLNAFLPVLVRAAQCLRAQAASKDERKGRVAQLRSLTNAQKYLGLATAASVE